MPSEALHISDIRIGAGLPARATPNQMPLEFAVLRAAITVTVTHDRDHLQIVTLSPVEKVIEMVCAPGVEMKCTALKVKNPFHQAKGSYFPDSHGRNLGKIGLDERRIVGCVEPVICQPEVIAIVQIEPGKIDAQRIGRVGHVLALYFSTIWNPIRSSRETNDHSTAMFSSV